MSNGERFIPEEHDVLISLEHWHRYLHILDLVKDKDVIDIASGTGYGTNLLAQSARNIIGFDISLEAISNAKNKYIKDNLKYFQGSVDNIPCDDHSVDVVVSFETIEHISEDLQFKFLHEVKRILKSNGILIISTPEKYYYSDVRNYINEYHVKEFYEDDFKFFLNKFFSHVLFNYQTTLIGSNIFNNINEKFEQKYLLNDLVKNVSKEYVIAYCKNEELFQIPKASINIDYENKFFNTLNLHMAELWKRINESESRLKKSEQNNQELWKRINESESRLKESEQNNQELWKRVNESETKLYEIYESKIFRLVKRFIKI